MKTKLIFTLFFSLSFYLLSSQVPQGFNYQAIARDGGSVIVSQPILARVTIQTSISGGTAIWQETHSVTTDPNGVMLLIIGSGSRTGGTATFFSDIDWSSQTLYLKMEIKYPLANPLYADMGTTQLWSVPYSMVADELSGSLDKLSVSGKAVSMEEALFEVKNNTGQTVFAVYNEGVRIYVSDGDAKGAKGGFAIGGFDMSKGVGEYLRVSKDSIRIYLNDTGTKASKGGFAIGGFDLSKGVTHDYFQLSRDSIRMYFNNNPPEKARKGGFAIGGFDLTKLNPYPVTVMTVSDDSIRMYIKEEAKASKGGFAIGGYGDAKGEQPKYLSVLTTQTNIQSTDSLKGFSVSNLNSGAASDYMNINKINYSIGHESGLKTNPNLSVSEGKYNVFIGYRAGLENIRGYGNIFMGHEAGRTNEIGSYNLYMGFRAGNANQNGNSNVFLGYESGSKSTTSGNTYIGQGAGKWNATGTNNTYIGCQAGTEDGEYGSPGSDNVYIGFRAGAASYIGNNNVYIGSRAGELNNNYRSGRIFIGYNAGYNDGKDNTLYIDNSNTTTPLIYGDFSDGSEQLVINGRTTTNGSFNYGEDAAANDSYVVSIQGINAYSTGMIITFKANTANTTACSVNVNSLGAKSLKMRHDQDPISNFIEAGSMVVAVYDGTNFQMIQAAAN